MTQPNELIITISRLPDNSAFTVEATDRNFVILSTVDQLLEEVKTVVTQHSILFASSRVEQIKVLERELQELKTQQEPIKMKNFTLHSLTDCIISHIIWCTTLTWLLFKISKILF